MSKNEKYFTKRSYSFRALYYWSKFLGINPLTLSENNQLKFSYLSLFYSCLFGTVSCWTFYFFFLERVKMSLPAETPISVIGDYTEITSVFLNVLLTSLIFGFFQHRIKLIVKSFVNAEKTSRTLGITEDYEKHFVKLGIYLIVVNTLFMLTAILFNVELSRTPTFNMLLWMAYSILQLPSINAVTVFVWCIGVVKYKLHRLHEKTRLLVLYHREKSCLPDENVYFGLIRNFRSNPTTLSGAIDIVSQQRRELIEVIDRTKEHFQLLILWHIITQIPVILVNAHITYTAMKTYEPAPGIDALYASAHALWVLIPVLTLMGISNVCGSTVKEANETGNILHAALNSYEHLDNSQEVMKFNMFSFEVLQNRVSISLFGLVDLDYLMVYKVVATAIAYFVIMLQFYN